MRVLVLHDPVPPEARPDEQDNLVQAQTVAQALRELGHDPRMLSFVSDLRMVAAQLRALRPEVVFNLVESVEGSGRLIHVAEGLLETVGVPFTGCDSRAMFLTSNKIATKQFLTMAGIATPTWACLSRSPSTSAEALLSRRPQAGVQAPPGPPSAPQQPDRFIIKSVWEDASLGLDDDAVYKPKGMDDLCREIRSRTPRLGGEAFAETYIDGLEFNLSLLERSGKAVVLPPAEIEFRNYPPDQPRIVGYRAKWQEDSPEYRNTVRRFDFPTADQPMIAAMELMARQCWDLFELTGYARVDFRVDAFKQPWVLEINANPCLSPDAGFVAAAAQAGLSFHDVIAEILSAALDRGNLCP